ncbi:MAG: EF-hand domain-containing protein [Alphaproteobacteria bacterium]
MLSINPLLNAAQPRFQSITKDVQVQASPADRLTDTTVKSSDQIAADRSRISDKPFDLIPQVFLDLFQQFDADKNQLVTREELTNGLKAGGASEKDIQQLIDNVLSESTDTNGDGLSLTELSRRLRVDQGDTFAAADLNSDNQITAEEVSRAFNLYAIDETSKQGINFRTFFANADTNKDKILTRGEFDSYDPNRTVIVDPKPSDPKRPDHLEVFRQLFGQFDADNDGVVTREEIIAQVVKNGGSEDEASALADNVLSATTDIDGNGLSFTELQRRLRVDQGDTFAASDLNSDGQITAKELDQAIALYQKAGIKLNEDTVRKFFSDADLDSNNTLSHSEFVAYNNGVRKPVIADTEPLPKPDVNAIFQQLFTQFDTDKDGLVTRKELVEGLQGRGFDDADIDGIVANVLSATTDLDGNGLSRVELDRRLRVDAGDSFSAFDLNSDGSITLDELNDAVKRYGQVYENFSAERARRIFSAADLNSNNVLTRAELDAFGKGAVKVASPNADAQVPVAGVRSDAGSNAVSDVRNDNANTDLVTNYRQNIGATIATLDAQLVLLLQQDQA